MRIQFSILSLSVAVILVAVGCQGRLAYNLPPSSRLMQPGPGVGGPGPGVIPVPTGMVGGGGAMMNGCGPMSGGPMSRGPMSGGPMSRGPMSGGPMSGGPMSRGPMSGGPMGGGPMSRGPMGGGVCQCNYQCSPGGPGGGFDGAGYAAGRGRPGGGDTSQIAFLGEDGLRVQWDVSGSHTFDSVPLIIPGRQNFTQGAIYRLKVSNIPGRPGAVIYPTLEIAPVTPRTDAYLAHAPVPVQFTEEDFDQVLSGNFVTKVIYLPDPEFQELALSGVETLVSTRLDPGVDPIAEADRRGSILAVLRMGNKDLEMTAGRYDDGGVLPVQFQGEEADLAQPVLEIPLPGDVPNGLPMQSVLENGGVAKILNRPASQAGVSGNIPVGVPTAGFAPVNIPPQRVGPVFPHYGMPITGTPIGLPGPPHIPLGSPAGFQKHVMKNRTRMAIPPPVDKMKISVKQRPGLNYPKPVRKVMVDETTRSPFNLHGLFAH